MTLDCTYTKRLLKSPAREVCCLRTFADLLAIAMPSRWRLQFTARSLPCTWYVSLLSQALHCCLVFLSPVPLMQLQGDALAAPLHWYYSWDIAQQHLLTYYNGRIHAYSPTHPAARHPDSGKYFARVKPTEHPVPGVFRSCRDFQQRGDAWGSSDAGVGYHATLPAGANTFTMQVRLATSSVCTGALATLMSRPFSAARLGGRAQHAPAWPP